jgi:hypothetical protein
MPTRDIGVAVLTNDEGAGNFFIHIAAAFAYDWFTDGREAAFSRGREMIEQGARETQRFTQRLVAERAERAGRTWQLSLPHAAYAGRFCNREYGTIQLSSRRDKIRVRMGVMSAEATPLPERDAVRVELIPNSGMPLQFTTQDNRATALRAFGTTFSRCG